MSDRTEEEQIEALKRWWKDYGKSVSVAAVIGLGVFFGWNYYQDSKAERSQDLSVAFEKFVATATAELNDDIAEQELSQVQQLAGELTDTDTLYGDFAELYLAKLAVQSENFDQAKQHLQKVADRGSNQAVKDLAKLRLARVLANKGEIDAALTLLSAAPTAAYAPAYAEARGDLLLTQNRLQEAQTAYRAALGSVGDQPMRRNILQLKLDNTRVASDTPANAPQVQQPGANPHALPNPHDPEAGDA